MVSASSNGEYKYTGPTAKLKKSWMLAHHPASSLFPLIMEEINDLFSPEALRLLEGTGVGCETTFQSEEFPVDDESSTASLQPKAQKNQRTSHSLHRIPGCKTLSPREPAKSKRKRAIFDREKVATVRKKGACLRCRVLKIPVSHPEWDSLLS